MQEMIEELQMAFGDWRFLILTGVMLAAGLVVMKKYRKQLIVPLLIIMLVVINPLFYKIWIKFVKRAYWRILWTVPLIVICSMVPTYIIDNAKKQIVQTTVLMTTLIVFFSCGMFIYDESRQVFKMANNPEKLPDDVVAIGEVLLNLEEHPKVVADASISVYLRQYSGKIGSLYARDIVYGNPSSTSALVRDQLVYTGNMFVVAEVMSENGYSFLVTENDSLDPSLKEAGFTLVQQVNKYGIYFIT